jgi:hypothetical protein
MNILPRKIIPDFIQSTEVANKEGVISFPYGGYYEVKATQGAVTLTTSSKQIEAYLNILPNARTPDLEHTAGENKAAQLTLVVPYGTKIGQDVIDKATSSGVNLYVTYPFLNRKTGSIIFSTPQRLNNISKEAPYPGVGNINKPANPDVNKATEFWKPGFTTVTPQTNEP